MPEYNKRIEVQRRILRVINDSGRWREELFGLSSSALDRWMSENGVNATDPIGALLRDAATRLLALANHSQEQITEAYEIRARRLELCVSALSKACDPRLPAPDQ